MEWDWDFVRQILPTLIQGVKVTILATLLGSLVAAAVGLAIAIARRSENRTLARCVGFFAEFIRGTPLLVQLYFIFYVLPDIGILLPPLVAGVIGLGLHYGTYAAEVYRAGIDNVPRGQWEAAKACNLTVRQTWMHVILPQAFRRMLPPLTIGRAEVDARRERRGDRDGAARRLAGGRRRGPRGGSWRRSGSLPWRPRRRWADVRNPLGSRCSGRTALR